MSTNASPSSRSIPSLDRVPEELRPLKQWLVWKYQESDKGKPTKVPYSPKDLGKCSPTAKDRGRWSTAEKAITAAEKNGFDGIGFVFTPDDQYVGIDFDAAIDQENEKLMPWAGEILKETPSYIEFSVSGTGLHVLCEGKTSRPGAKANVPDAPEIQGKGPQVEIYSENRYFVFTGDAYKDRLIIRDQRFIEIVEDTMTGWKAGSGKKQRRSPKVSETLPADFYDLPSEPLSLDDQRLVDDLRSRDKLFRELWDGELSRYDNDQSKADFGLVAKLLEHTGRDRRRTVRLFTASALGQRDKWRDREDYRKSTVEAAYAARPLGRFIPQDAIEAEAVERFGPPFEVIRQGKTTKIGEIYEPFFAGLYAFKNRILWSSQEKCFYQYSPVTGLWRSILAAKIRDALSQMLLEMSRRNWTAAGIADVSALLNARRSRGLDSMVRHLEGMTMEDDPFKHDGGMTIHLANGMLVHKGAGIFALEPFSPEFRSRNMCPIPYDPDAKAPRMMELVRRGLSKQGDVDVLFEYAGQCLHGHNRMQRMLVIKGPESGGKSTVLSIVQKIIGVENCCELRPSHLDKSFEQARFIEKTLLCGADVPGCFFNVPSVQRLKAIVGGDFLNPERKNSNEVLSLRGDKNVIATTNEALVIRTNGDAGAWRRRLIVLHFNAPPPERVIRNYDEVLLKEEGAGILNLFIEGFRRLLAKLEATGGIALTEDQTLRIETMLPESERFRTFLKTSFERKKGSHITTHKILEHYAEFAEERGWDTTATGMVLSRMAKTLIKELFDLDQSHSVYDDDDDEVRGYRGLAFKDAQPPAQE